MEPVPQVEFTVLCMVCQHEAPVYIMLAVVNEHGIDSGIQPQVIDARIQHVFIVDNPFSMQAKGFHPLSQYNSCGVHV